MGSDVPLLRFEEVDGRLVRVVEPFNEAAECPERTPDGPTGALGLPERKSDGPLGR